MQRTSFRVGPVKRGYMPAALLLLLLSFLVGWLAAPTPAQAGLYDKVKGIIGLPGDVTELKDHVEQIQNQYEESMKQLEEAKLSAEQYKEMQEQLLAENARLAEQNQLLLTSVSELKKSEEARERQAHRLKTMVLTTLGLAVGYFVMSRLARYLLRARSAAKARAVAGSAAEGGGRETL